MQIGPWKFSNRVFVAPMAGVTDRPYRRLCKALGAEYAVSEMAASNPQLWDTVKTARRLDHEGEPDPIAIQLTGADRKSTRLNSSHVAISYAVFCLKKKTNK